MRVEKWNGYDIRFIEVEVDDWWAVAKDVAIPLGHKDSNRVTRYLDKDEIGSFNWKKQTPNKGECFSDYKYKPNVPIISETGIYEAVFNSEQPDSQDFKKWVKQMIKLLRKSSGLEGFQIFRMLDKDHQKEAMGKLKDGMRVPVRVDFIKANKITNKAVSSIHGHPKALKKEQMTPEMLVERQDILEDTVNLMTMADKFKLDLSISKTIYGKYLGDVQRNRTAN
ncbi:antirepressor [Paenibacillus odorifer]|nr:antirepressor [Paenibacillus odorifer]